MWIQVGKKYAAIIQTKRYKIHILSIVDDEFVVYKFYGKHKQWWHYDVKHITLVEQYIGFAE